MLSREKAPKKDKNAFAIERIPLLQVHFSHFIAKQGTIFKQGTQFSSARFSSGLIYYGPDLPHANYFIIIIDYEVFLYFFPNQFFQKIVFFLNSFVRKSGGIK